MFTVDTTPVTGDVDLLIDGITAIGQNIFDLLVLVAPVIAVVVAIRWGIGYVRKLASGRR
jgi:hypothetical protein